MGLLEVFNYGTGNDYYAKKQKELDDKYKTLSVAGGKVDMTINRKTQDIVGPSIPDQKPPGIKIDPIQKNIPFDPSQGGTSIVGADKEKLDWLGKLTGTNMDKAMATWKEKGGFEGLMANPAFTMGLAFMQASAEGKTIGQGALDNVMKAAGISSHYKKIIEDRKQEPIQATAGDIDEVKGLLRSMNVDDPGWHEKLWGKLKGKNVQMQYDIAAEDIALEMQKEIARLQEANKGKKPLVFGYREKEKILKRLLREGKFKKKGGTWFTAGTLESDVGGSFPKPMAQGGQIQKGQHAIVGEGGPEYFLPQESGKILSNDDSRIFSMLLSANPQLQNVSRTRAEKILRNRFPEYFE
jgi:hypothetical protein